MVSEKDSADELNNHLTCVTQLLQESIRIKQQLLEQDCSIIVKMAQLIVTALKRGNKVMLCGNGGSAADAQHIAAEFLVCLHSDRNRISLPALALHTDSSAITACANDYGYQEIFARLIEGLGVAGDILIALSTSGNSPNVIKAVETAHRKEILTIGLLGGNGGAVQAISDISLVVPSTNSGRVQEAHITIGHILVELVENMMFESITTNKNASKLSEDNCD